MLSEVACSVQKAELDSPEDFAGRIVEHVNAVQDEIEAGRADRAARYALNLGALVREFQIKCRHEPTWARGAKYEAHGRDGGRPRTRDRDVEMAEQFERRFPGSSLSASELKAAIGKEWGLKRTAGIDAVDRGLAELKKSSGKPAQPDEASS
jgi:hypothetical protein